MVLYARQFLDRGDPSAAQAAEDVVQEVFVRLVTLAAEPANVKAWLYTAVRHASIAAARSGSRRRRREHGAAAIVRGGGWFRPAPEDLLDAAAAGRALAELPPVQREVVVLRLWSGMTLAEIAGVTGSSVSGVFAQYRAALAAVRKTMGAELPCRNTT